MNRLTKNVRWFLSSLQIAALCVILSEARPAQGQYRIETYDGHMNDASNRVGGGGYNNSAVNPNSINAEYIYLGDVTGYGGFKGNVPDRDPRGFTGYIPPQPSLNLQRAVGSSSVTAPPTYNAPSPYFNQYTAASSLVPLQQIPGTGSYLVAPPPSQAAQDYRLGSTLNVPQSTLPLPGETIGPGAVNPQADMTPTFLENAPVGGVNPLNQPVNGQLYAEPGTTGLGVNGQAVSPLVAGLSARDLIRLRGELSDNTLSPAATSQLQSGAISNLVGAPAAGTAAGTTTGAAAAGLPVSGQLPPSQIQGELAAAAPMQSSRISPGVNNYSTGQQERTSLPVPPPPAQQSPQYAKLRVLLEQYNNSHPLDDEAANRQFQAALEARRQYEQSLVHPAPTSEKPSDNGKSTPMPTLGARTDNSQQPAQAPPPSLQVGPIGADIRASGLSQLVQQGEDMARRQHFKDAISKFMDARQVAPNNMLIAVDLANAQLGAGFYAEAEQSLRNAYASDPATQMGKFDLKSEIGDQRLQVLIADLKQLAAGGDSATPVFLLAYLSYNEGDTDKAVEYLHLAQTRAGGQDELIRSLGEHWTLPTTQPGK